jgi:hypothetical protein
MTPFHLLPPQFVNWTLVQREGQSKPDKIPVGVDGRAIDHTAPASWLSYDAAVATGQRVAFVLTENDPYVFIDLDNCRDPMSGMWSPDALQIMSLFPGALMEISQSGRGVHIIGTCDQRVMEGKRKKWEGDKEVYTWGRFVALTGTGLQGDPRVDLTAPLAVWVPNKPDLSSYGIPETGPVPEWNGETDDVALIGHAMSARGGISVQFGQHASFRDLWTGNATALQKFYPSYNQTDPFDRSAADAALVMHLGFWTGKDMARTERLWRAAPLTQGRGKLDRQDYVHQTIMSGLQKVKNVYVKPGNKGVVDSVNPPPPVALALPGGPALQLPGTAGIDAPGYLTIYDQMRRFDGLVYVTSDNAILCRDGLLLDRQRFDVIYGGYEFQMTADGSKPSKSAWEAFTTNRTHHFPKVARRCFTADAEYGAIIGDAVNTFRRHVPVTSDADVTPYLDLLHRMMPDERDRRIFLTWCAALAQDPGHKFQWAVVLQGAEGNGKTFLLKCLEYVVGQHLTHLPNPEDLDEKYNAYIDQKLFIGVEEIHMEGRRDVLDRLKKYITNSRIEVRAMRVDKMMVDNLTNWMFLTNYKDAVFKSRSDRRYSIFFTAQQAVEDLTRDGMTGDYFPRLWTWARAGGFAAVAGYLSRYQRDEAFDPAGRCHRAPETSSTHEAIVESRGVVEQILVDATEQGVVGLRDGWISSVRAAEILEKARKNLGPRALGKALENIGYVKWGRSPINLMQEGGRRPYIYCLAGLKTAGWDVFLRAQGYDAPGTVPIRT